jgi:hypothetical protein
LGRISRASCGILPAAADLRPAVRILVHAWGGLAIDPFVALPTLDRADLIRPVRQVLGRVTAEVRDWRLTTLSFQIAGDTTRGVYRLAGTAEDQGTAHPWSLLLKVLQGPRTASPVRDDPQYWCYWKCEALVYQAGLLEDPPSGLLAPGCCGVVAPAGPVAWIWLTEVGDLYGPTWPLAGYGRAARHLGGFNGAYLVGRPLPVYPWLSRDFLRSRLSSLGAVLRLVEQAATWDQPVVQAAFPVPVRARLLQLWAERARFLQARARLPQTLCHLDAWRGNLFAVPGAGGGAQTLAIDWAFVGLGAAGPACWSSRWSWPPPPTWRNRSARSTWPGCAAPAGRGTRDSCAWAI